MNGLIIRANSLFITLEIIQRKALVVVRTGIFGIEAKRLLIGIDSLLVPLEILQYNPLVVIHIGIIRIELNRLLICT